MRILLHDYPGHAFPVQLSRELARRGHVVHHLHSTFFQGPKGDLARTADDPAGFHIEGLSLGKPFGKYNFLKRYFQEMSYGRMLVAKLREIQPEIVFSGNGPLDPQAMLLDEARRPGLPFVFWLQDLYSIAIDRILRRRLPLLGGVIGRRYIRLEGRLLRESDAVVGITEDFRPVLESWNVAPEKTTIIENWAPIADMPVGDRVNRWSSAHGLDGKLCLLYAGSMGLKHNPSLILSLAQHLSDCPDIEILVVSEGQGADWLNARKRAGQVPNLTVLPFQPVAQLPEILASADILLAILEPEAGAFSVPSKILNYLCAGRPVLGAIPPENLASRIITGCGAGVVVAPDDVAGLCRAARDLTNNSERRIRMGRNAREYAEEHFNIEAIGDRFEHLLLRLKAD